MKQRGLESGQKTASFMDSHSHFYLAQCYDMEVGENRTCVFYGTEKREGEKLEIYTGGIGPYSSTVYQTCNMSPTHVHQ